ncbi:MAG: hypothetical protein ACYS9X_06255 [Planctomycetota bacterium]
MTQRYGVVSEDVVACMACVALAGLGLVGFHYEYPVAGAVFWAAGAALAGWAWFPRPGRRERRRRRALARELASRGYVESAEAAKRLTREVNVSVLDRSPWHFTVERAWTAERPGAEIAWVFYRGWVDEAPLYGVFATALFGGAFPRRVKLTAVERAASAREFLERFQVDVEGVEAEAWAEGLPSALVDALLATRGFTYAIEGSRLVADWAGLGSRDGGARTDVPVVEGFERVVAELARHAAATTVAG